MRKRGGRTWNEPWYPCPDPRLGRARPPSSTLRHLPTHPPSRPIRKNLLREQLTPRDRMKTRTFLAVILVGIHPALGNTTWQGDQGDSWHETFNWSSGVPDATDTAFFGTVAAGNSIKPRLFIPGVYDVGTINFTAGAPAFTITVDHTPFVQNVVLNVVGGGIINSSSNTQSIMNAGEVGTDSAGDVANMSARCSPRRARTSGRCGSSTRMAGMGSIVAGRPLGRQAARRPLSRGSIRTPRRRRAAGWPR